MFSAQLEATFLKFEAPPQVEITFEQLVIASLKLETLFLVENSFAQL